MDRPFIITQNIYKLNCPSIRVHHIHESNLTQTLVQQFLDAVPANGAVGIAPLYDRFFNLTAVALSAPERVLLVHINTRAERPRPRKGKNNASGRELLTNLILCSERYTKYALFMDLVALSLFYNHRLRIANAVDLQDAVQDSRGTVAALVSIAGGETGLNKANLTQLFVNEENEGVPIADLALQAWFVGRAGGSEKLEMRVKHVVRIHTTLFSDARLFVLARLARQARQINHLKPTRVENEVENEFKFENKDGKLQVTSTRYKTRVLESRNQRVEVESIIDGIAGMTLHGKTVHVDGRTAHINLDSATLPGDTIRVTTVGREAPTIAEKQRDRIVMQALQRTTSMLSSPFFQALWLPGEAPVWPQCRRSTSATLYYPPAKLNSSQTQAVRAILSDDKNIVLVQGPPGSGKTTVIAAAVMSIVTSEDTERSVWLVAQSNVAVKNIAEKLADVKLDFTLIVSKDFHYDWHEHLYGHVMDNVLRSDELADDIVNMENRIMHSRVVLCTLGMLSNPRISAIIRLRPLETLMVDEASQIEIGDYVPVLNRYSKSLEKMVFIGDNKQLPPHRAKNVYSLQSVFELKHLRNGAIFLDTQYRMPLQLGAFIGKHVYDGQLKTVHRVTKSCLRFVDVLDGVEVSKGHSWINVPEAKEVIEEARQCHERGRSYRILTPYDAQRSLLEMRLKAANIPWENKVFNVDSFQGNEDDYIIVSVVRTEKIGFLSDLRRVNVMLTRCKKGMSICTKRQFVEGAASSTLVGLLAEELGDEVWV